MSLSERQVKFSVMIADLVIWAAGLNMFLTYGEAYRTDEQQMIHVANGKSKVIHSKHQDRLAVDFNLYIMNEYIRDKELYRPLGEKWEALGGRWGGRFGVDKKDYKEKIGWDSGHFEY